MNNSSVLINSLCAYELSHVLWVYYWFPMSWILLGIIPHYLFDVNSVFSDSSMDTIKILTWREREREREREIKRLRDEETKPYLIIDLGH